MDVQNKRVLVVGLARSGLAVARALVRRGAVVTVSDNKPPAEFRDILPELIKDKVGLELGSQRVETFLKNQIIVTSPGIPWICRSFRLRARRIFPSIRKLRWPPGFSRAPWWASPDRMARPPPPRCWATC